MSAPALYVSDLRVVMNRGQSDGTPIVHGVDLSLAPGELMGVVGETGAGKTLTMKALLGLLPPRLQATGTLAIAGSPPTALTESGWLAGRRGRDIGVVLQNPAGAFNPLVRIKHQLTEGVVQHRLASRPEARARALELLDAMGFDDAEALLELYPHQLSGGMNQRVAIAMALMPRPGVLIADEPTSALDAHLRVDVLRLLRRAASDQGTAVLLVSHDLGLVSHFSDSIAVMYAGRVVERGPSSLILSAPQHPYTDVLLRCSPTLVAQPRAQLAVISGAPPAPGELPPGCPFEPRCPCAFERCRETLPILDEGERSAACHLS